MGDEENVPLREGVDYYVERGNWVFTAGYLERRGYCCGNGCRHCPYGHVNVQGRVDKDKDKDKDED